MDSELDYSTLIIITTGQVYPMSQINGDKHIIATEDVIVYAQWSIADI